MGRPRHPDKHIEKAVQYAESLGWRVVVPGSHAWGRLFCPSGTRDGCIISVWSTPRVPINHARQIVRTVDLCPHGCTDESCGDEDAGGGESEQEKADDSQDITSHPDGECDDSTKGDGT